jgi:hypothetical protein
VGVQSRGKHELLSPIFTILANLPLFNKGG